MKLIRRSPNLAQEINQPRPDALWDIIVSTLNTRPRPAIWLIVYNHLHQTPHLTTDIISSNL